MTEILTVAEQLINEFGKENIFLVDADYHGLYEDDHCNFTYWNNVNGTMPTDYWTTAMACPNYGQYECMTIKEAHEKGLLNEKLLLQWLKATSKMKNMNYVHMISERAFDSLGLRIEAYKGRKWKGIGYLIGSKSKSYQWGVKMWQSDNDYGTSTTNYCKIYDPMTGRIEYINRDNCRLLDEDELKAGYIKHYNEVVDRCSVEDIVYGVHGPKLKVPMETFEQYVGANTHKPDTSNAFDETEFEEKRKASEFRTKKMTELVDWVKNNTDKEGDEIMKLAEGIFRKKYC